MTAPLLVFGWGNPSRGDDALGPFFVEQLKALAGDGIADQVEFLHEYQLQIEHALDLVGRTAVLFVDASLDCGIPFQVTALRAARDVSFTSHALTPEAVMEVYRDLHKTEPPPCSQLAIRGMRFDLGDPPGPTALSNLAQALEWGLSWIALHRGYRAVAETPARVHA